MTLRHPVEHLRDNALGNDSQLDFLTHTATHTATALGNDSKLDTHTQPTLQQPSATIRNSIS